MDSKFIINSVGKIYISQKYLFVVLEIPALATKKSESMFGPRQNFLHPFYKFCYNLRKPTVPRL